MDEELRGQLTAYIRRKFASRPNSADIAEDAVQQATLDVIKSPNFSAEQLNFGYLAKASLRAAYKQFVRNGLSENMISMLELDIEATVCELETSEDTELILQSLETLREVERIVVTEHYYGQFSFREISQRHGINLNTVLSHHRRALVKLRSELAPYYAFVENSNNYHYGGQNFE